MFYKRIEGWVRASPYAAWMSIQDAGEAMAAVVSRDAPMLSGNKSGG